MAMQIVYLDHSGNEIIGIEGIDHIDYKLVIKEMKAFSRSLREKYPYKEVENK
jgi:hypothetical protein